MATPESSIVTFGLQSAEACSPDSGDAHHFAVVRSVMSNRNIRPRAPAEIPNSELTDYDPQSLISVIKQVVMPQHRQLTPQDVATIEMYRLCQHLRYDRTTKLQLERIGIFAVTHLNSVRHPVKPVNHPDVNEDGVSAFNLAEIAGTYVLASVYPTLPREATDHPVTEIMTIPHTSFSMHKGNTALRGIETIIDEAQLL